MQESHNHVRNLHPGIVDVILNIHVSAGKMQQADKSVSEDGVAEVSDVRGLVRINAGVLDQNLPSWNVCLRLFIGRKRGCEDLAFNPCVDVASAGKLQPLKTVN